MESMPAWGINTVGAEPRICPEMVRSMGPGCGAVSGRPRGRPDESNSPVHGIRPNERPEAVERDRVG